MTLPVQDEVYQRVSISLWHSLNQEFYLLFQSRYAFYDLRKSDQLTHTRQNL